MHIRPIQESDLPAVLEVYHQCEDFLALGPVPTASLEMVAADRELSRAQGSQYNGLFAEDGTLMGIFDFVRSGYHGDSGCAYIELLMIAAPYRGRGLGEEAVRWLELELKNGGEGKSGISMLRAGVQANNPGAIRFWQRMGFAMSSEAELLADGTTCYRLQKDL
jgi:ribosomal protein S18 acetylase RimI-like enzyme